MNIFVGNLSPEVTESDLKELFEAVGEVKSAKVIMDHATNQSRGFGFVEMFTKSEALKALSSLNGKEVKGQEIKVNEARPRNDNRRGGGGYNRWNR